MRKALLLAAMAVTVSPAFAGFYPFDEPGFVGAINPDYYLEDFNGYTYGNPLDGSMTDQAFGPVNGYSYNAHADNGLWSNDGALSTNTAYDVLKLTFTGKAVTAFGGFFVPTDVNGANVDNEIDVAFSDGFGFSITYPGTSYNAFVGYTSNSPLDWVQISCPQFDYAGNARYTWPQIDHIYVGVPEPATITALVLGGAALIRRRRR